jgi:hypothetical protein
MAFCAVERITFVVKSRALLSFGADFKQFVSDIFNTVPALRGHEAPEKIRHPAIRPLALPLKAVLP